MKKVKIVRHTLDSLPPLTTRERRQLDALAAKLDGAINLGDIPPLTDARTVVVSRKTSTESVSGR